MFLLSSVDQLTLGPLLNVRPSGAPLVYKLAKVYGGKFISFYCVIFIYILLVLSLLLLFFKYILLDIYIYIYIDIWSVSVLTRIGKIQRPRPSKTFF